MALLQIGLNTAFLGLPLDIPHDFLERLKQREDVHHVHTGCCNPQRNLLCLDFKWPGSSRIADPFVFNAVAEAYASYGASLEAGLDGRIDASVEHHEHAQLADAQHKQGEAYVPYASMDAPAFGSYTSEQVGGDSEHDAWRSRRNSEYNHDDGGYSDGLEYDERNNEWREPARDYDRHSSRDRDYDRDEDRDRNRDRERKRDRKRDRDRRRETSPSPTLYMRGLPENCVESDIRKALEGESSASPK